MYFGYQAFFSYVFCKYFLPVCGSFSHSLDRILHRAVFNFNEVQLSILSFMDRAFDVVSNLYIRENLDFLLCYFLGVL